MRQAARRFTVAIATCLAAVGARAAVADGTTLPLLIGGYTAGSGKGIEVRDFDTRTGRIARTPTQVQPSENPSWIALSADHRFAYAVNENGPGQADPVGRVSAFRVDPPTGRLTPVNRVNSLGSEPTHAAVSADGRYLFVANYSVLPDPGGTLAIVPIGADGALQPVTQVKTHRASQVDAKRQASPHAHSSAMTPDARYVLSADLGADKVYIYRYDPAQAEAPLFASTVQPWLDLPPGSGPRHIVFGPDGKHAYLTLEMAGKVAILAYADGRLSLQQLVPLAAANFHGRTAGGAIHFSPDGRFLDVLDRGDDNQIVTFAVDATSGSLTFVERRSAEGTEPREFAFDPAGRHVLVANQQSHQVVVFARDASTGAIGARVDHIDVDAPSALLFVTPP